MKIRLMGAAAILAATTLVGCASTSPGYSGGGYGSTGSARGYCDTCGVVTRIDHREVGAGRVGPISGRLRDLYFDAVRGRCVGPAATVIVESAWRARSAAPKCPFLLRCTTRNDR